MIGEANPNLAHRLERLLLALRAVRGSIQAIAKVTPAWEFVERVLAEVDVDPEATATRPRLSVLTHNVERVHALLLLSLHGTHRDVFDKVGCVQPPKIGAHAEAAEWMHKATGRRYLVIVADMPPQPLPPASTTTQAREVLCDRDIARGRTGLLRVFGKLTHWRGK